MSIGRLGDDSIVFKRKFRWLFFIEDVIKPSTFYNKQGHICKITSRPKMRFNEQEIEHTIEKIHIPAKAEWIPMNITVYDLKDDDYLYKWMTVFYDPKKGIVSPSAEQSNITGPYVIYPKRTARIILLDGHGRNIEQWELQACWPIDIDWGELDMSNSDVLDVKFTLRYDRAILINNSGVATG
jgi:hypothetical protein